MTTPDSNLPASKRFTWLWFPVGALFGVLIRVLFGEIPNGFVNVMSFAFLIGTPFTVGALTIFGRRNSAKSIGAMIFEPWGTVMLMLLGCALALLEGSICLALLTPLFLACGSLGGLFMGLLLRVVKKNQKRLGTVAVLPFIMVAGEDSIPLVREELEISRSLEIDAPPERVWAEILTAKSIRSEELPFSLTHFIGVPRPIEGVNVVSDEGEVRHSRWERGVNFRAIITDRSDYESISWRYEFDEDSFPEGSMDDHVQIGGRYFDLKDSTFNLTRLSGNKTELEIIAHYRVGSSINFYAVPISQVLGHDFVATILGLYKYRSEVAAAR